MSIDLFKTIHDLGLPPPKGILQVGASYGQEIGHFVQQGIQHGLFIEPLAEPFAHLSGLCKQIPGFIAVNTLCTDESGKEYSFHIADNGGMSSSILKPKNHLTVFDTVKFTGEQRIKSNTLDEVIDFVQSCGHETRSLNTLYMDTQGSELKILMGGNKTLKQIDYIFTEIMRGELYEGQYSLTLLSAWLEAAGFSLNNAYFGRGNAGDALFIRSSLLGL